MRLKTNGFLNQTSMVAFGYYGKGNIGDQIFLETLRDNHYNINFQAISAESLTDITRGWSLYVRLRRLPQVSYLRFSDYTSMLKPFDAAIFGPGGLIWLDGFPRWCLSLHRAIKKTKIPWYCYGLGVEPADFYESEYSKNKILQNWREFLNLNETIYVRDHFSKELLKTNSIHDNVIIVNDISFAYSLPAPHKQDKKTVGINLRTNGMSRDVEIFPDKQQLVDLIEFFVELGYEILLIPFQEKPFSDGRENDAMILEEILQLSRQRDRIRILRRSSPIDVLRDIGTLDFFIGTRYHSVVFALRYGVPTCAIAYRPKVRSLMEEYYGLGEYVVAPHQVSRIKELFMDRGKIRSQAIHKTPQIEASTRLQLNSFLTQVAKTTA